MVCQRLVNDCNAIVVDMQSGKKSRKGYPVITLILIKLG